MKLDFPECVREICPTAFDAAWSATQVVLDILPKSDLSSLSRHNPALNGYDWSAYIRLSAVRMLHQAALLKRLDIHGGRVLDFGSYFGNFSLFARKLGFNVSAADNYSDYDKAFNATLDAMRMVNIRIIDLGSERGLLERLPDASYDVVLFLGVIEHIPHTPRPLLLELNRLLQPGGILVTETPNLAYAYRREQIARGQSIFPDIQSQFYTEMPFEGHHREYVRDEVEWMLREIGHTIEAVALYNYSLYGLSEISGYDEAMWRRMEQNPSQRELITVVSRKRQRAKQPGSRPSRH